MLRAMTPRGVAVVVPAYRVETYVRRVVDRVPAWVQQVVVVDDASDDGTSRAAAAARDPRVRLVRHAVNRGVGAAIATGYAVAVAQGAAVIAVMAGDDQMDPAELERVVAPVIAGDADYVKGNRESHPRRGEMPWQRRLGSAALARLTTLLGGPAVGDSQCGYTAISRDALCRLPLHDLWPRYGYPNDLLLLLRARGLRVREVPVRPVYEGQPSGLRLRHVATIATVTLARAAHLKLTGGRPR